MQANDTSSEASRETSARHARSNYILYLVAIGCGVALNVVFYLDVLGESDFGMLFLTGGAIVLAMLLIGVYRAYKDRKKADELHITHFRVQIRTFWIYLLYTFASVLVFGLIGAIAAPEISNIAGDIVGLAIYAWFVIRCVKGLRCLARQEPYPNPGTWLW